MDINKLKTFYFVAIEGSYQKASVYLGVKTPYISKHITALENSLQFKLFKRSNHSLILTEKGQDLLKSVQVIMSQIEKIEEIANFDNSDDNIIRIVTTTGVTNLWLLRKLKEFSKLYPKYKFRIIAIDEKIDVSTHYADIAILPKIDPDPNIVQRKLFTFHTKLFASKEYLEQFGTPKIPADLDTHRLISYYHNEMGYRGDVDWHLKLGVKNGLARMPYLVINSAIGLYEALISGMGIVSVTQEYPYIGLDSKNLPINHECLVNILPKESAEIPICFSAQLLKMKLPKVMALDQFFRNCPLTFI
ncbi:MAG TPA: LysR family transcriptional regulator [Gammaproteobacteria bacterium]|nr:LysR family transcriptional regulator [Gammaproteobacteria bacterium]